MGEVGRGKSSKWVERKKNLEIRMNLSYVWIFLSIEPTNLFQIDRIRIIIEI